MSVYRRAGLPFALALAGYLVLLSSVQAQSESSQNQPSQTQPSQSQPAQEQTDAFGEEVTLQEKTIVFMKGTANWDTAFESLVDAFKSIYAYLDREKLKAAGPAMTIYTSTDDTGFQFEAAVPVAQAPASEPKGDIGLGKSPSGKALKFVHRGSYDAMDVTYDAITNHLDEKKLEAKDLFIEQYVTDPLTTPEDRLVIEVYVPIQ